MGIYMAIDGYSLSIQEHFSGVFKNVLFYPF